MSQAAEDWEEGAAPEEAPTGGARRLPRWKIVLVGLALLMGVAGMALHPQPGSQTPRTVGNLSSASEADTLPDLPALPSAPVPAFDPHADAPRAFAPRAEAPRFDEREETTDGPLPRDWERRLEDWSPLLTQLGFSFVVGFSIGYVLLIFLRTTAFLAGLVLLALFGLQYLGVLYLNWQNIETSYQSVLGWVLPRAETFRDFITDNLSSSGTAAIGILTGLTRR